MSIFRETFPQFVQNELKRRQDEMAARTPAFLQQLNTRSAWVRMTSGVNTANTSGTYNNDLASKYVLQGGTLLNNTSLRTGLGGSGTSTYDTLSPGGVKHRLGIRPMPGITNVSIQSKGAYGSLQEATVSFNCWDIKQLEDLELLYMRPGYTVLLEFGWDFAKNINGTLPQYKILNAQEGISINDAFADIYSLIEQSNGTYDALLGYVTNYNWSARDDGGYDCTTTIISLGEVLESLKCNWVPIETTAFSDTGLLNLDLPQFRPLIKNSYELGIIPGLLHEMWGYLRSRTKSSKNFIAKLKDPKNGNTYQLCMSETMKGPDKFNRGGLPKPLGDVEQGIEGWITLGSFCDLLNNYVLLKDQNNNPLTQITTYETDSKGNINNTSLKCIASPLSLSTNLGICLIRNNNWTKLKIKQAKKEETEDKKSTLPTTEKILPSDLQIAFRYRWFRNKPNAGITGNVATRFRNQLISVPESIEENAKTYRNGKEGFQNDLNTLVNDILNASSVNILTDTQAQITVAGGGNTIYKFNSTINSTKKFNVFEYLYNRTDANSNTLTTNTERAEAVYNDLFAKGVSGVENIIWGDNVTKKDIIQIIETTLSSFNPYKENPEFASKLKSQLPQAAQNISEEAAGTLITTGTLDFLFPENDLKTKTLGSISNIYVNINYLYSQAVSKNVASNDNQNTNNISIREYLQSILRDIQNSLGNINQFDIQVDERTAIGRIIDLNFTGDPTLELFKLEIHNTNSVVRKYGFQSKIFPEMGSIIAISAQDPSGIGKLGYDNATLVAWNEGIKDRLIPKKTFTNDILLKGEDPTAFILPFLTKINDYFEAIKGQDRDNINFLFGGLDFAYRDFLANLNRFDRRNNFKTIIPTSLDITLDGIGGMVIGNLFTINQDIVPKGYRNIKDRKLAYIVTKLGHSISDNDWTTELSAYPVIFETATGTNVASEWDGQKYLNSTEIIVEGVPVATLPNLDVNIPKNSTIPVVQYLKGKKYSNGQLPNSELRYLKIPDDPNSNKIHKLYPSAATQWEKLIVAARAAGFKVADTNISYVEGAAYRSLNQQIQKRGFATPGTSIHGWGAAVDIQSIYSYQEQFTSLKPPVGAEAAAKTRAGNKFYQWLEANAAAYGWINPANLRDGAGDDEAWHWEYWGPLSGGAINQPENSPSNNPTLTGVKVIAKEIKEAVDGDNLNYSKLIASIKKIKDVNTFREVNKIVNIQKTLNDELGFGDAKDARTLKEYLSTIGVIMNYSVNTIAGLETNNVTANSIKITYR